jgi:catechol 2,3-dioxygenase-like lactoylglutathione lyase family enzyme
MDGRRRAAVAHRCGAEQNPAYRPTRPPRKKVDMQINRIHPYGGMADLDASRRFYVDVLGLEVAMEDPVLVLRAPTNPSAQLIICPPGFENPQPNFGIDLDDRAAVDIVHAEAGRRGLNVVYPLSDEPWGVHRFFVEDPGGSIVNILAHND